MHACFNVQRAIAALLVASSLPLLSCGGDRCRSLPAARTAEWEPGDEREPTGESSDARIAEAGAQTWALALDLLRVIDPDDHPSIAASPASMTIGLGLAEARWPTRCGTTILEAMHAVEEGEALHNTLGASVRALEQRSLPEGDEGEDPVTIKIRNSSWDLKMPAPAEASLYGAVEHRVAAADTEERRLAIREVINCTIEEQSDGLLVDFLPEEQPMNDTTAYDVNVAVLKGPWENGFDDIGAQDFTLDSGQVVDQEMMNVSAPADLYLAEDFTAVSVPLRGDELSVMIVAPREGEHASLAAFTASLTAEDLRAAATMAERTSVDLTMPRFSIDSTTINFFKPLGLMCDMFTLRSVFHGATVELDPQGIKAAAATVAESWDTDAPESEFVYVDRSFLFFAFDRATGFVLYSGRYAGPA